MKTRYKLLLATDYSEAVMNAERYAVQFAKNTNSWLTLLHVYEFPLSATPTKVMEYAKTTDDWRESELKRLEQHRNELFHSLSSNNYNLISNCEVQEGSVGKQIRKAAKEMDADFVIVGTHGAGGFREVMFGTHAWDVIKKSSVPVIAVPKEALFTGIKNIVFGTEYREGEMPVINFLTQFAKQFDAEVTILHATNYVLSKELERTLFEKFRTEVKSKNSYPKLNIRLVHANNITEGLNTYCEHSKTDLLVMSPEKPFLFEKIFNPVSSVTKKMTLHTHIPLMTIPDFYNPEYAEWWKLFDVDDFVNEDF